MSTQKIHDNHKIMSIYKLETVLDTRLDDLAKINKGQFYEGFKECLGLMKAHLFQQDQHNLGIVNRELSKENTYLKDRYIPGILQSIGGLINKGKNEEALELIRNIEKKLI